jgi:hypothetical protein
MAEPLRRVRVSGHEQTEAGGVHGVPFANERSLVELTVLLGKA